MKNFFSILFISLIVSCSTNNKNVKEVVNEQAQLEKDLELYQDIWNRFLQTNYFLPKYYLIFNPLDFLYNLFGKKPKQFRKLKLMKEDNRIRELLGTKFDRETLTALLQVDKLDIDEILRNCSYSENFILSANDLQILEAISQCYEEYKLLNRK